ncbi:hypothetical protein HYH02_009338 [Chlamydomonas schloesseri]|uniref:Uncharacterized protein n=1 Tax=Chlamydomonas schloesseri TaxID=2026947 RepID=A0A835TQ74_9CHLO|nr:hypothetical protein HYH02_009338 [Chlamydomonas schloesseri]|eukprot:KAG2443265.1 hypothetical protein HYH02_009338 [Chlamydomonas schloesseri]
MEQMDAFCSIGNQRKVLRDSCVATSADDSSALQVDPGRLALAALLHACVDTGGSGALPRPLRIGGPQLEALLPLAQLSNNSFSAITGIPVIFDMLPKGLYSARRQSFLLDSSPPNYTFGYDALIASSTAVADAAQVPGKLVDVTMLVAGDSSLAWNDILPSIRTSSVIYDGSIVGVPLIPSPYILSYRKDIFDRDNLAVPQTWEQFAELAERYHNGRDGLYGACIMAISKGGRRWRWAGSARADY